MGQFDSELLEIADGWWVLIFLRKKNVSRCTKPNSPSIQWDNLKSSQGRSETLAPWRMAFPLTHSNRAEHGLQGFGGTWGAAFSLPTCDPPPHWCVLSTASFREDPNSKFRARPVGCGFSPGSSPCVQFAELHRAGAFLKATELCWTGRSITFFRLKGLSSTLERQPALLSFSRASWNQLHLSAPPSPG